MTPRTAAETLLQAGISRGVLPPDAQLPPQESRPWPVVLLTALGAWLAAIPLIGAVGLLFAGIGNWLVTGVLLLAGATVVLRAASASAFIEQLAVPALLVGGAALGAGLHELLPARLAAAVLCLVVLALGALVDRVWVRWLAGATAAGLFMAATVPVDRFFGSGGSRGAWIALHLGLLLWVAALTVQQHVLGAGRTARWAALVESLAAGWLLPVLAGLAVYAGMTLLAGASLGGFRAAFEGGVSGRSGFAAVHAVSSVLAACGGWILARSWPVLRHPGVAVAAVTLAVLSAFLPSLGAVLLALAVCAASHRWLLCGAATLAAAWIVGAFYYQLAWPLATKAALLVVAGAALAACAWGATRRLPTARTAPGTGLGRRGALVLSAALAALAVANIAIWQKQRLIAHGDKVYVALAPVDPRSLMQGDFMRLRFALPGEAEPRIGGLLRAQRPSVVATRDARQVARLHRIDAQAQPLAAGEFRIELTPKDGRWILVSDAWFFREGDAARFEAARFGEFRVLPDGRALLVGLADAQLRPIVP